MNTSAFEETKSANNRESKKANYRIRMDRNLQPAGLVALQLGPVRRFHHPSFTLPSVLTETLPIELPNENVWYSGSIAGQYRLGCPGRIWTVGSYAGFFDPNGLEPHTSTAMTTYL